MKIKQEEEHSSQGRSKHTKVAPVKGITLIENEKVIDASNNFQI